MGRMPPNEPAWPTLNPVPPELEELPENPTPKQIIHVLSTTLLAFGQLWPRIVQALLYLKAATERLEHLPPMRRSEDSSAFLNATAHLVGEAAKTKAAQIVADPHADLTPEIVGDLVRTEVQEALAKQREADHMRQLQAVADKVEADKVAAEKHASELAKERRERNRNIFVGVVVGIVLAVLGVLLAFAQGRLMGHDEGYAERGRSTAPAIVSVPVPVPVPAPAPTAPAAVVPR